MTPREELAAIARSWRALMLRTRWDGAWPDPRPLRLRSQAARDAFRIAHAGGYVRWAAGNAPRTLGRGRAWRGVEDPPLPRPNAWPFEVLSGFISRHPYASSAELAELIGLTDRAIRFRRDALRRLP
jgi:hypothetical protein